MAPFNLLPVEILNKIYRQLDGETQDSLRHSCKLFYHKASNKLKKVEKLQGIKIKIIIFFIIILIIILNHRTYHYIIYKNIYELWEMIILTTIYHFLLYIIYVYHFYTNFYMYIILITIFLYIHFFIYIHFFFIYNHFFIYPFFI